MATVTTFKTRFPEFDHVEDVRVQLFLDDAELLMGSTERWLSYYEVAHQYHAAHLLTVALHTFSGDSGILSPVKKQEVDDVVIENAISSIAPTLDDLYSTSYGKQYVKYRRICFTGMMGV